MSNIVKNPEADLEAVRDLTESAHSAEDIATLQDWHKEARHAQVGASEAQNIGHNVLVAADSHATTEQAMAQHSGYENGRRA